LSPRLTIRSKLLKLRCHVGDYKSEPNLVSPRQSRWDKLNACLEVNKIVHEQDNGKTSISTPLSSVKYDEVKAIFGPITRRYELDAKVIPPGEFELLHKMISFSETAIGEIITGKEAAKRLYFISHILVMVCALFNGGARLKVDEDVCGKNVRAHGQFEFMLVRGDRRVCVVEAKRQDMEQALTEALVGCEVVADNHNSRVVCAIVTDYTSWTFLKSCDDRVERMDKSLGISSRKVNPESLMELSGQIYAMLSSDD
jgi:hypothetical protein